MHQKKISKLSFESRWHVCAEVKKRVDKTSRVQLNEGALDKISKQFTNLNQSFEELKGELHDARCKVDEIEDSVQNHVTQISQMYERLLSLERYSREYNLRFHNIEESPGENCLQKIHDILANQLNLEAK